MRLDLGVVVERVAEDGGGDLRNDQHQTLIILGEVRVVQLVDGLNDAHHTDFIVVHDRHTYHTLRLVVRAFVVVRIESVILVRIQDVQDLAVTSDPPRYALRQLHHDDLFAYCALVPQHTPLMIDEED